MRWPLPRLHRLRSRAGQRGPEEHARHLVAARVDRSHSNQAVFGRSFPSPVTQKPAKVIQRVEGLERPLRCVAKRMLSQATCGSAELRDVSWSKQRRDGMRPKIRAVKAKRSAEIKQSPVRRRPRLAWHLQARTGRARLTPCQPSAFTLSRRFACGSSSAPRNSGEGCPDRCQRNRDTAPASGRALPLKNALRAPSDSTPLSTSNKAPQQAIFAPISQHMPLLPMMACYPAQQLSFATSLSKVWAASFSPSTVVR